jgi:XTP/dITP diphosphohydrolase
VSPRVVLATRNAGKVAELRRILAESGLDVELVGLDAFEGVGDIAETGTTFAANALLKAREVARHTGLPAIADDSGLCVDALNGMPGILSARWSGRHGDDEANLDLVLGQLADTPEERRGAHFFCAAAIVMPDWRHRAAAPDSPVERGEERVVEGQVDGLLLRERRGAGGFGYDPIFLPYGSALTTAEMAPAAKDAISHRGQAFRALAPVLARMLGTPAADG